MLHIILTILKIIGILTVVVLLFVCMLAGAVLFVPVRYRINGKKEQESFFIKIEAYWLFHLLRFKTVYPIPKRSIAKVLWFTVYDSEKENRSRKRKKKKKSKREKEEQKEQELRREAEKVPEKETQRAEQKKPEQDKQTEEQKKLEKDKQRELESKLKKEAEQESEQKLEEKKNIFQKILSAVKNIRYTIFRFCDKIKEIWANIQYYIEILNEEETKRAFSMCRGQLYKIWKNICPKKCRAELKIGTGEPDTTGYILALHGMLYPVIGNNIRIEPDFEKQTVEGTVFIKGRVTLFVLLYAAVKLYFDQDIRHFVRRFKKEEE